jgi:MoaA/NifB/PqqE/SkfB family radical SAM enzyme
VGAGHVNSTIAKHNVAELPDMLELALSLGADALHLLMLVPVGCGLEIAPAQMLAADEHERVLHWFDEQARSCPIDLKATCAPHYFRVRAQRLEDARRQGDRTETFVAPGTRAKAAPRRRARPVPLGDDARLPRGNERLFHLACRAGEPVRVPAGERR